MMQNIVVYDSAEERDAIQYLAGKYGKYGLNERCIKEILDSGKEEGLDFTSRYAGVRLALSHEFHEHELFSMREMCHALGQTEEEIRESMREMGESTVQVSPAPWIMGGNGNAE